MSTASDHPPLRLAVVGAGSRGTNYARLAAAEGARISAVVEPDPVRRARFLAEHVASDPRVFDNWQSLAAASPRAADAVVIATPDRQHTEPAVGLAHAGMHILLEKPMAPTEEECERIVDAAERDSVLLAVCHVMRYSRYTQALKKILAAGHIGDIVSVQHLEPIGWWHFAHSYVRGNWAREQTSNSMLMAKSCHDIDWLSYIIGRPVTRVSSFGSLTHFTPENKPAGATARCWDCPLQYTCAYSATRVYPRFLGDPVHERWPLEVLTPQVDSAHLVGALRDGPYGRCVYGGGNDAVDHQVVNIEYDGGVTVSFTVTAFTELDFRKTRVFGTYGCVEGDGRALHVHDFRTDTKWDVITDTEGDASAADGHGGADHDLIVAFLGAVADHDPKKLLSGPRESLASHEIVWAAERSRREGVTVGMR